MDRYTKHEKKESNYVETTSGDNDEQERKTRSSSESTGNGNESREENENPQAFTSDPTSPTRHDK